MVTVLENTTPRVLRPIFSPDKTYIRRLCKIMPTLLRRKKTRCVDPREDASQKDKQEHEYAYDGVARPGGDFGYIMVLMGAYENMSP